METKINKVGTSLGLIIPGLLAKDCDLKYGTRIEIELNKGELVVKKKKSARDGWEEAFTQYVKEGEDKLLFPDFIDQETDMLL